MNNIDRLFQNKQKNILSVYFTAGFPKLNDTRKIILELQKAGIDMIEIGIPFFGSYGRWQNNTKQ